MRRRRRGEARRREYIQQSKNTSSPRLSFSTITAHCETKNGRFPRNQDMEKDVRKIEDSTAAGTKRAPYGGVSRVQLAAVLALDGSLNPDAITKAAEQVSWLCKSWALERSSWGAQETEQQMLDEMRKAARRRIQ